MLLSAPLPPCEGIGFYGWNLARELTRRGHTVHLITRGQAGPSRHQVIEGISIWKPTFVPIYPWHVRFHALFVQRLVNRLEPELDLIHLHSPLVSLPATSLPILATIHTPMKADVRSIKINSLFSLLIHLQAPISIGIENRILRRANGIVAVSSSVANELGEYGIKRQDVTVAGNGVDVRSFFPSRNDGTNAPSYFLTVGRLGPRKGLEDLVDSVSLIREKDPNLKFYLIGEGPLRQRLQKKVTRLGLNGQVIFLGHVSEKARLVDYYQKAAGYIHPAHYEGLPTVLLEAMACGKPVVATAVSGALDVIRDRENGLLIPPRSPQAIASAVFELLDQPALAERIGLGAVQTIRERYSWNVVGGTYEALYGELVHRSRSR
ncbi:MAG: glycosyltransferase family 4 protein [Anaerolineales bacterium]|nr:glycosyltransferase family 4 protein [Anaerolineales bacterium]